MGGGGEEKIPPRGALDPRLQPRVQVARCGGGEEETFHCHTEQGQGLPPTTTTKGRAPTHG